MPGIIPIIYMPATARIAIPLFLSLLVWVIFIGVGFKHQGSATSRTRCCPPGVPEPLYILVAPIEFISTFLVRPFSLAVRLFANMLAGHILLVTFALLTEELVQGEPALLKPVGDPAVLHAGVPHRVRGAGAVPAGVHLHDPRLPCTSAARRHPEH